MIELHAFLYRADNPDSDSREKGQRDSKLTKDSRLKMLNVAFEIATRIRDTAFYGVFRCITALLVKKSA